MTNPTSTSRPFASPQNQPLHGDTADVQQVSQEVYPEMIEDSSRAAHDLNGADMGSAFDSGISPAEANELALSQPQRLAIELMLSGSTMVACATAAGVTRKTLYNWLHHDAKFQAAYNAWQLDAATRTRSKMLAMADEAVYTVGVAIKRDARLAFDVLKSLGVMERPTPGSTDPEEIQQRMKLDQMQAEADLMTNRFDASIGCLKKE